jgi:ribonuclease HII
MRRALDALPIKPSGALVDGNRDPDLGIPTDLIIKGDQRSIAISAASILAKTHRDTVMKKLSQSCPGYGWETNMGYGTKAHQQALKSLGITPHHRKNFAPVRKAMT